MRLNMDRKLFTIAMLSMSAMVLVVANWSLTPAQAQVAVKDRDYIAVTARIQQGGDGLYVTDNRTGQIAVFVYDPNSRSVRPRAVRFVADAFGGAR